MILLNPGNTPLSAGLLRGVIAGVLIGAAEGLRVYVFEGLLLEHALARALMFAIPVWLGLTGYGAADQVRATQGIAAPADVPVQIKAETSPVLTPEVAAKQMSKPAV